MSNRDDLLDDDGENRAVRSFLMQYSCDRSITVAAMGQHMNRSGWPAEYWPPFARNVDNAGQHLTKAGAQLWMRHLFSLERAATQPASIPAQPGTGEATSDLEREITADAAAFEATLPCAPARVPSSTYPWGWRYTSEATQTAFRKFCQGRSACPACPKDTPYGPATCFNCVKDSEASAGSALTDEAKYADEHAKVRAALDVMREYRPDIYAQLVDEMFDAAGSHIKVGGQATAMVARAEEAKDAAQWREMLACVMAEMPQRFLARGNAPGHGHSKSGIWDSDNGVLAGKECAWCKVWNAARKALGVETEPNDAAESHP